jgi:hypothetical protein
MCILAARAKTARAAALSFPGRRSSAPARLGLKDSARRGGAAARACRAAPRRAASR